MFFERSPKLLTENLVRLNKNDKDFRNKKKRSLIVRKTDVGTEEGRSGQNIKRNLQKVTFIVSQTDRWHISSNLWTARMHLNPEGQRAKSGFIFFDSLPPSPPLATRGKLSSSAYYYYYFYLRGKRVEISK